MADRTQIVTLATLGDQVRMDLAAIQTTAMAEGEVAVAMSVAPLLVGQVVLGAAQMLAQAAQVVQVGLDHHTAVLVDLAPQEALVQMVM